MNLNVAALEVLVAKGLSAQDILDVARALSVKSDTTAAERQQRRRDKIKSVDATSRRDVTRDAPNDIYSNPQHLSPDDDKSSSPPKPKTVRSKSGMASLPDGWEPALTPAAQQIVDGWPPGWLEARITEFRDHATDKGRKSKDWQAAFRTWIIKADEWQRQRGQHGNDRQGSVQRDRGRVDGFTAACREVAAREADYPFAGNG